MASGCVINYGPKSVARFVSGCATNYGLKPVTCSSPRKEFSEVAETVRILFIGDIVGRPGRHAIQKWLPSLRKELCLDFVIANGENAAGGIGITEGTAKELLGAALTV
jgi:Uncharacterized protein conserved in bacteria, COG1692